jgi:hypothetical protein
LADWRNGQSLALALFGDSSVPHIIEAQGPAGEAVYLATHWDQQAGQKRFRWVTERSDAQEFADGATAELVMVALRQGHGHVFDQVLSPWAIRK